MCSRTCQLSLSSCQKDESESAAPAATAAHLKFSDAGSLKQAITEISKAKDKESAAQVARRKYAVGGVSESFHSLLASPDKNVPVLTAKGKVAYKTKGKGQVSASGDIMTLTQTAQLLAADEVLTDQMVPDPNLAAVLNENLEIQVGDQFYKVTPEGTYATNVANQAALDLMVADNALDPSDVEPGALIDENLYDMGQGVTRYDTFGSAETVELLPVALGGLPAGETQNSTDHCGITQPDNKFSAALTRDEYCAFPSYGYGAKTLVGGVLQSLFGVNTDRTNNFDGSHRVKVKLYNFNYRVYSSIGLKVKFQKKGWTGIWDARATDKLVVGWDAVIFEAKQKYSAPSPYNMPSFPSNQVASVISHELLDFYNFDVRSEFISEFSHQVYGNQPWNTHTTSKYVVDENLDKLQTKLLAKVTKDLWNYAEQRYAPGQIAFRDGLTSAFRMVYPEKVVIALSRFEVTRDNAQEIDLIFDWNTAQLTYSGTIGGNFSLANNVLKPTYSNQAQSYTVRKASIYGAAKRYSDWKGIRIVQE